MTQLLNNAEENIAKWEGKKGGRLQRVVRRLTLWAWKSQVRAPIYRLFERGLIDSRTLHEGTAFADRMLRANAGENETQ